MDKPFHQICVLGAGLLGASLLMAAKKRGLCGRAVAWSPSCGTRQKARKQSWCDCVFDSPADAVRESDLVVACAPVQAIIPLLEQIAPFVPPKTLVTDVGSVKEAICLAGDRMLPGQFIGSHPMAGSEKNGLDAASDSLFEGHPCFLAACDLVPKPSLERLSDFWTGLGMRVETVDPKTHDQIVARVSHLPHAVANALCATLARNHPQWKQFSGNGLRDTTRIAASDPELWTQIFAQNKEALLKALDDFSATFAQLRQAVASGDAPAVKRFLAQASDYRSHWTKN